MSDHYTSMLDHLVSMARFPGAKDYAWHRAKYLASDEAMRELYPEIDKRLAEAMQKEAADAPRRQG